MPTSKREWHEQVIAPLKATGAIRCYLSLENTMDEIRQSIALGLSKQKLQEILNRDEFKEYINIDHYKELIKRCEEENLL